MNKRKSSQIVTFSCDYGALIRLIADQAKADQVPVSQCVNRASSLAYESRNQLE